MKVNLRFWLVLVSALIASSLTTSARGDAEDYTDRQLAADKLEFERNSWLETYKKIGHHDPRWDKDAPEFLDQFCRYSAWEGMWRPLVPDNVPGYVKIYKLGRKLVNNWCDDPQVLYAQSVVTNEIGNQFDTVQLLRKAFAKVNDGKHPPEDVVRIAHFLRNRDRQPPDGQEDAINAAIEKNSIRMCCGFPPTRSQRYLRLLIVQPDLKNHPEIEDKVCDALAKTDDVDPWLRGLLLGEHETHLAWKARGNGGGAGVTPEGWQGFEEHLAKARDLLTDAWKIDPSVPGAADAMIPVAMGDGDDRSARTWYERAITAKFDDVWARDGILWALRPRWIGSFEELFALGKKFAATKRYDTSVPYWLYFAIASIAQDRGDREQKTFGESQFYKAMQEVLDGYHQALPPGRRRDALASWQAAFCWRAQQFGDARKALDELGEHLDHGQFANVTDDPELAISQIYAYSGQWAKPARDATTMVEKHDDENAISRFRILVHSSTPDDKAYFYYNSWLSRLMFPKEIASGNWVDIQPKDALYLWRPDRGQWSIDKDGRLVGVGSGLGLRLRFRAEIGPDYEVVATMSNECPPHRPTCCGLFIDHDGHGWANGLFYSDESQKVTWYSNRDQGQVSIPSRDSNELDLKFWAHHLSATFNGKKVQVTPFVGNDRGTGANGRLAIAQLFNETDTTLVVTGLKVRLLREEPK